MATRTQYPTHEDHEGWALFHLPMVHCSTPYYLAPIRGGITRVSWFVARGDFRWAMKTRNRLGIEPEWCLFWETGVS